VAPTHEKSKNKFGITKIPDKVWDEIISVLSAEKPDNTIGRPIVPYRKIMDGIVYVLRTGVNGRCCRVNMVPVSHAPEGSRNGLN
jgi:transposase